MATLPGIPSVPLDAPAATRGFLTAVRSRLLAMTNQFTDAQAASLLALIGQSTTTSTNITNVTNVAAAAPVFLAQPYRFYVGTGVAAWTAFSVSDAGVPANAAAVLIQSQWVLLGDVGTDEHWAALRVDNTKGNGANTIDDAFCLALGLRGSGGDQTAGSQQGMYPVVKGQFEYSSGRSGFGWSSIDLRIIGYIPGAAA